jgi:hypothetical protein
MQAATRAGVHRSPMRFNVSDVHNGNNTSQVLNPIGAEAKGSADSSHRSWSNSVTWLVYMSRGIVTRRLSPGEVWAPKLKRL